MDARTGRAERSRCARSHLHRACWPPTGTWAHSLRPPRGTPVGPLPRRLPSFSAGPAPSCGPGPSALRVNCGLVFPQPRVPTPPRLSPGRCRPAPWAHHDPFTLSGPVPVAGREVEHKVKIREGSCGSGGSAGRGGGRRRVCGRTRARGPANACVGILGTTRGERMKILLGRKDALAGLSPACSLAI